MALGFVDEKTHELKARDLIGKREDHGKDVSSHLIRQCRRFLKFEKLVGENVDIIVVVHECLKSKQGKPQVSGKSVMEAVADYFTLCDEEKSWGDDAKRHAKRQLERFTTALGSKRLHEVGLEDVREWLRGLTDNEGEPLGAHSVKDHRKNVKTFFDHCLRERWGRL